MNSFDKLLFAQLGFQVVVVAFINFFVFIVAGLFYFIPIDLSWHTIGKGPAILLGAFSLWIYSMCFAFCLIKSFSICPRCKAKHETE